MSQIQQVKDATDIVEVIGARVDLKRSGANFRGLCPFHSEKSPSFFVSEVMQRFRCFGCGESGDVFEFLEKYDGLTFYEALQQLADKAGITLKTYQKSPDDHRREEIKKALDLARQYYHWLLTEHKSGQAAREYLKDRGVTKDSIELFQLGFAQDKWEGLIKYLHGKKKIPLEIIQAAGLIIKSNKPSRTGKSNFYDRFRNRIMFPLKDHRGQVVGFSGRTMDKDAKEAKYINTPETMLYHKSKMLFGYSELFNFIRQEKRVVVVEGEFDVISSVQAHVNNIVAIKGSALTQDHAKLLGRSVESVILSLDTDEAGIEATKKAIEVLRPFELELRAIIVGGGKDPDDLASEDPKAWRQAVKTSISAYEYLIRAAFKHNDPKKPDGRRRIIKELGPILAKVPHAVELDYYLKMLSEKLGVQKSVVANDVSSFKQKLGSAKNNQSDVKEDSKKSKDEKLDRRAVLEEYLLFLLFHSPEDLIQERAIEILEADNFLSNEQAISLLKKVAAMADFSLTDFSKNLAEDLQQMLFEIHSHPKYLATLSTLKIDIEWQKTFSDWQTEASRDQIEEITNRLAELDAKLKKTAKEEEEQDKLLRKIVQLRSAK